MLPTVSLKKTSLIHHKIFRIFMGYLRSTPINIIMSGSFEMFLKFRRIKLGVKFTLNQFQKKNIQGFLILDMTPKYWTGRKSSLLIRCYYYVNEINSFSLAKAGI